MGKSWEEELPEHELRTFKEIKKINAENVKLSTPGKRPPEPKEPKIPPTEYKSAYQQRRERMKKQEPTGLGL